MEVNMTIDALAKHNMTRLPPLEALEEPFQSLFTLLYSLTAFTAFVLNTFALLVLLVGKRTSLELRKYLANLAIVDLFLAVFSIPFSYTDFMFGRWLFPNCLCPVMNFVTTTAVFVNIYTLIGIGFGRYFAIVYPLDSVSWLESHTSTIIIIIWINGIALGSPLLYQARAVPLQYGNETYYDCRELWEGLITSKFYTILLFALMFIIPFMLLAFLYGSIGLTMIKRISPGNADTNRDEAQNQMRLKVVKMLITLVIAFAIAWFPLQLFNLIVWIFDDLRIPKSKTHYYVYVGTYFTCHWLSTAHSFVNPIIYCIMSSNFSWIELRNLFRSLLGRKSPNNVSRSSYNTMSTQKHSTIRSTAAITEITRVLQIWGLKGSFILNEPELEVQPI